MASKLIFYLFKILFSIKSSQNPTHKIGPSLPEISHSRSELLKTMEHLFYLLGDIVSPEWSFRPVAQSDLCAGSLRNATGVRPHIVYRTDAV